MIRLSLLVALALVGCQSDPAPDASGDAAPPDPTAESAPEAEEEVPPQGLVLEMGGLGLVSFGAPLEEAIEAVSAFSGDPTDVGGNPECGAGPLTYASWDDGLLLYGAEGEWVGWYLSDGDLLTDISTMEGIGLGSTRSALEQAYAAEVFESSLGTEFYAVPLGEDPDTGDAWYAGLLDGDGPDAGIESMWAGVTCSFR